MTICDNIVLYDVLLTVISSLRIFEIQSMSSTSFVYVICLYEYFSHNWFSVDDLRHCARLSVFYKFTCKNCLNLFGQTIDWISKLIFWFKSSWRNKYQWLLAFAVDLTLLQGVPPWHKHCRALKTFVNSKVLRGQREILWGECDPL